MSPQYTTPFPPSPHTHVLALATLLREQICARMCLSHSCPSSTSRRVHRGLASPRVDLCVLASALLRARPHLLPGATRSCMGAHGGIPPRCSVLDGSRVQHRLLHLARLPSGGVHRRRVLVRAGGYDPSGGPAAQRAGGRPGGIQVTYCCCATPGICSSFVAKGDFFNRVSC